MRHFLLNLLLAHEDPTEEESEFFVRADFNFPIENIDTKLLYFLNLGLTDLDIAFGAGIFVNVDKAHGMRTEDNPNSVRYGRLTLDDVRNRVPVKKELFVICAAGMLIHHQAFFAKGTLSHLKYTFITSSAAAAVTVDDFVAELDVPIPSLSSVQAWLPKLNVGGDIDGETRALQAIIKTEKSTRRVFRTSTQTRYLLQPVDRRRLEASISSTAHRGLRMLCVDEVDTLDIECPVNITAGEFACVRISNVRLDITKIQELVEPILKKLVDPVHNNGTFDEIAIPLEELDKRLPGISDLAGVSIVTFALGAFL